MKASFFQIILIGVFIVGALGGLFVFATYKGGGSAAADVGTVRIWGTLPNSEMNTTLSEIGKFNQGVTGVSYVQRNPATLASDLASAIATGGAPDLVLASQEELQGLTKLIEPIPYESLSEATFTSAFVDEAGLFTTIRGQGHYGIPFLVDPLVLFWNNDILSSSGVAKPPATWEALVGLVQNLAVITPSKQIKRGLIGLGTYDNVHNARGILSALFLQTKVPMSSYAANGTLSADLGGSASSGTPAGQAVLGFYTQFADPTKLSYTWNGSLPDSQKAFLVGDLALYLGYVSEARFLRAANPNLNFNVAPLPQPSTATSKSTYGLVYAFMIPNAAKNGKGGYRAALLLTQPEEQAVAAANTWLAPATRTALSATPPNSVAAVAYASALYSKGWLSPSPQGVDDVFSSMIGNIVSGRESLQSALTRASGSLTALFRKK